MTRITSKLTINFHYTLFIDDEREPPLGHNFDFIARSYDEAAALFEEHGLPSYVSFDHDLGEGKTGYDIAKLMVDLDILATAKFPYNFAYRIHSQNPIGAENIKGYLDNYFRVCNDFPK